MDLGPRQRSVIQRFAALQSNLIEITLVAVLLGFGVGLAASSLSALLDEAEAWGIGIGLILSTIGLLYLFAKILSPQPDLLAIEGFLHLVEKDTKVEVRPVSRYALSEKVSRYLHAAFTENPALLRAWLNSPARGLPSQKAGVENLTGKALMNQAVEYFFLDNLSLHLSAYFQEQGIKEEECRTFTRADIPDVLLQNRFLEMFSRPMEERESFADRGAGRDGPNASEGRVVWASGRGGALFDLFELILPKGSQVSRSKDGIVNIDTNVFSLEFDPGVEGFVTNTPRRFEELYMGEPALRMGLPLLVKSEIKVTVKRRALFSRSGWEYYRWLDTFISDYYKKADQTEFLQDIGWEIAVTANHIAIADAVSKQDEAEQPAGDDAADRAPQP